MSSVIRLTDTSFKELVSTSDCPVLVEFWASWCPPCKMMDPVLSELAAENADRVVVAKINADQNPRSRTDYAVQGVPTFFVFVEGEPKAHRVGALSKGQIIALLQEAQAG